MEKEIVPIVKSPARGSRLRKGEGFSLSELKKAGKTVEHLKRLNVNIDYFRKSTHDINVDVLKKLKISETRKEKRAPFKKKDKKKRVRVKKVREISPEKEEQVITKKTKTKTKEKSKAKDIKVKKKPEEDPEVEIKTKKASVKSKGETKKKETPAETTGIKLTDLSGLGPATAKKLIALGVKDVEALCKENPGDLAKLIKGISEDRLTKWIEEGKEKI